MQFTLDVLQKYLAYFLPERLGGGFSPDSAATQPSHPQSSPSSLSSSKIVTGAGETYPAAAAAGSSSWGDLSSPTLRFRQIMSGTAHVWEFNAKPHPARTYLMRLYDSPPSPAFAADLEQFRSPKEWNPEVFQRGITLFTKIANLTPSQRQNYYGNKFAGINYSNCIANLWNEALEEKVKPSEIEDIAPPGWDCECIDHKHVLVYRGNDICAALDKLLQGPTPIDCAMFCQLSIWFGIRYMLGDEMFRKIFGRAPFYLTQLLYQPILSAQSPHLGNPLYQFFVKSGAVTQDPEAILVCGVPNHKSYLLKHPGGLFHADNCVVIKGLYTSFGSASNQSRDEIETQLLSALNAPQDDADKAKLELYAEQSQGSIHPRFNISYLELIKVADSLKDFTAEKIELDPETDSYSLRFDFPAFCQWLEQMQNERPSSALPAYSPLPDARLSVPRELLAQIPRENKYEMTFDRYTVNSPQQKEMREMALKFCADVRDGRSTCLNLSGQAGIGKTAAAVCCAKELASLGKRVVWISEATVNDWIDKKSGNLAEFRSEIHQLLAMNPDAVFLDDDNLVSLDGGILLEEIYAWYVGNPKKGLFITSNRPISFQDCYGIQLSGYHIPPFAGYTSPQYMGLTWRTGLEGSSMRPRTAANIMDLSDEDKFRALSQVRVGVRARFASVGIIVGSEAYAAQKHTLSDVEFVPAFAMRVFDSMTSSMLSSGDPGPAFLALTPEQQAYTYFDYMMAPVVSQGGFGGALHRNQRSIFKKCFETTEHALIVVELLSETNWDNKKIIQRDCLDQLVRVVHFAHDQGGKKIIILNNTGFSQVELLTKIKEGIGMREQERTMARIEALLLAPALAGQDQDDAPATFLEAEEQTTPAVGIQPQAASWRRPSFFYCPQPPFPPLGEDIVFEVDDSGATDAQLPASREFLRDTFAVRRNQSDERQRLYDGQLTLACRASDEERALFVLKPPML